MLPTINNFPPTISKLLTKLLSRQELGLSCILEMLYVEGSNVHRVRDKCNKNDIKISAVPHCAFSSNLFHGQIAQICIDQLRGFSVTRFDYTGA